MISYKKYFFKEPEDNNQFELFAMMPLFLLWILMSINTQQKLRNAFVIDFNIVFNIKSANGTIAFSNKYSNKF